VSTLLIIGAALFFAGGLIFLVLLFASGGAARSRQFEVLGQLWSGRHGPRRRRLLRLAFGLIGSGAVTCFAAVAARRCPARCALRSGLPRARLRRRRHRPLDRAQPRRPLRRLHLHRRGSPGAGVARR
jgi:hypothetical protein